MPGAEHPHVDLTVFRDLGEVQRIRRGRELFRQGSAGTDVFVVVSGAVELRRRHGRGNVPLAIVGPGRAVGDLDVFMSSPRCCTARVLISGSAIRLCGERLLESLARQPTLCARWLVATQRQLHDAHQRIDLLSERSVLVQVAQLLLDSCDGSGVVRLSQGVVADHLSRSRQTVNESVRRLRELGAIEPGYRSITVLDALLLEHVASGAVE